jgi:hypothetical protein
MFRALYAHHKEVKILLTQHLVSSLSVGGRSVHRLRVLVDYLILLTDYLLLLPRRQA